MMNVLGAVQHAGLAATCVYPNSDRGHSGTIEAIETYRRRSSPDGFRVVPALDRDLYLKLLIESDVLIGNSSSGIIEAATAGTPAVNVGSRQWGRERNGRSVIDADESLSSIRRALGKALRCRPITRRSATYGKGDAGRRIAALLASMPLTETFRRKVHPDAARTGRRT